MFSAPDLCALDARKPLDGHRGDVDDRRMRSKRPVWVVVRYDQWSEAFESVGVERRITVVKVLDDGDEAQREAARLNTLNGLKGCLYWSQMTRWLEPRPAQPAPATPGSEALGPEPGRDVDRRGRARG